MANLLTGKQLQKDLEHASEMYQEHLEAFAVLWRRHSDHREDWIEMSREPEVDKKAVKSVYKHNGKKGMLPQPGCCLDL
jgi:hypothetical protein